jgi:hypothetical protein
MKTLILRIHEQVAGPPPVYPVELLEVRWRNGSLQEVSLASNKVPAGQVGGAPATPGSGAPDARDLGPSQPPAGGGREAQDAAWLYDLVFQGEVARMWQTLTTAAAGVGPAEGRRLILAIVPDELRRRRWEWMSKGLDRPGAEPTGSLVRGPVKLNVRDPLRDDVLKILIVVGSAPQDAAVLAEEEVQALEQTFAPLWQEVDYQVLKQPTRDELSEAFKSRPDIFHFIGHGQLDNNRQPFLHLYQRANQTDLRWPLEDILRDFGGVVPSFVFLNACHTVDQTDLVGAASMTDLFLDRIGARAVLGMHAAVRGTTAGRLAGELYRALARGDSLDLALTRARNKADILKSNDPRREWDWALPYLRLAVLPEQVLPVARAVPEFLQKKLVQVPCFEANAYFVDRVTQHREFLHCVQPDEARTSNLVLITGAKEIGKTHLIRSCLQLAARRGRLVKYVELDPAAPLDFLGVLRLICEGDDWSPIAAPLPAQALERFYQTLNALLRSKDPGDPGVIEAQPKQVKWRPLPVDGVEDQVEIVFRSFLEALQAVPARARDDRARELTQHGDLDQAAQCRNDKRPFLLVLDQIAARTRSAGAGPAPWSIDGKLFTDYLVPYLIRPFARGRVPDVLLVLGVTESAVKPFGLDKDSLGLVPTTIPVGALAADQFQKLAEEYFQKRKVEEVLRSKNCDPTLWRGPVAQLAELFKQMRRTWSPMDILSLYTLTLGHLASQQP